MNLRDKLLSHKPKVKPVEILGDTYYIREFTVGEMNKALYGQQQELVRIAESQGITLDFSDEDTLTEQLAKVYDKHKLTRTIAMRLCDENGVNLFNAEDENDLEALSQLDKAVIEQLNQAIMNGEPKNSPAEESSK